MDYWEELEVSEAVGDSPPAQWPPCGRFREEEWMEVLVFLGAQAAALFEVAAAWEAEGA